MTITPSCDMCGDELADFGGILLSPPSKDGVVKKFHLCVTCYESIEKQLKA